MNSCSQPFVSLVRRVNKLEKKERERAGRELRAKNLLAEMEALNEKANPIKKEDGKFFWWDETWSVKTGPYDSYKEAEEACIEYCETLDKRTPFKINPETMPKTGE